MNFEAFYERIDEETFEATRATASPWDERLQHRSPRDEMPIARINSEFLGGLPLANAR